MDIWAWVNQAETSLRAAGQGRLADLLDKLPSYTCDNRHAQVDAVYPEALALAKASGRPWLEVFVRHWNLQSRILHRYEVADWMEEAVSLIEFAHREETRECPQSVCVTQDLVSCYGNIDGPGYAPERLAATEETLARIDAKWPCWTCISSEHAEALIDGGRAAEALDFATEAMASMVAANARHEPVPLAGVRVEALIALGRLEPALALIDEAAEFPIDRSHAHFRSLDRALVLCLMERFDEARQALLPFEVAVETQGQYDRWTDVVTRLAMAGTIENTWGLDARLRRMQVSLVRHGIARIAIGVASRRARLALARDRSATARACCAEVEALLPKLRQDLGAAGDLAALRADITASDDGGPRFEAPTAAIALCTDDPEADLEVLQPACERWPDHEELRLRLAHALRALGRFDDAEATLRSYCGAHPEASEPLLLLGNTLLAGGRTDAVLTLAAAALDSAAEVTRAGGHWLRAQALRVQGDLRSARDALEALLELRPGAVNATTTLAEIEREVGEFTAACDRLDALVAAQEEAGPWDWDLMVVATILGRWPLVRRSAARVGFEVEGEGPIDEAWGFCRIRFNLPDGAVTLFAHRTGPVTARVVQMQSPGQPQFFRDEVVFEAAPLNEAPADDEAAQNHAWEYAAIASLTEGGYRVCAVDGVHPGEAAWEAFVDALDEAGCAVQVASGEGYELVDPEDDAVRLGIYAYVAAPAEVDDAALDALLTEAGSGFRVLVWPDLLEALGESERAAAQLALAETWDL